jgi:hypothetical protein
MDLKSFYVQTTQGEVKNSDDQVKHRSDLDELLGMSTVSFTREQKCALVPHLPQSCVDWLIDSGWSRTSTTFSMRLAPVLCRLQFRVSSRIRSSVVVLVFATPAYVY